METTGHPARRRSPSATRPLGRERLRRAAYRLRFVGDDLLRWPRSWYRWLARPSRVRLHGVELAVDDRLGPGARREILDGRYERGEVFALLSRLQAGDRVMEFGTGIGLLAILAARRVGSDAVVTYEANPRNLPLIRDNFRRNQVDPRLVEGAIGVGRGRASLHVGRDHQGASTVDSAAGGGEALDVPRIDAAAEVARFRPSFLIVDIEGVERDVVPAIDWSPVERLLLELHPRRFGPGDEERILDHLLAVGFRLDPIVSSSRKLFFSR
ncbi:MAG TPA: FkbM family methyltransferase [Thermoanaerobaculia bacterium]|nr:FkbM family methyltransferase [Thermoanaerobaculia bacterium]